MSAEKTAAMMSVVYLWRREWVVKDSNQKSAPRGDATKGATREFSGIAADTRVRRHLCQVDEANERRPAMLLSYKNSGEILKRGPQPSRYLVQQ
jgi:hypothetical protein